MGLLDRLKEAKDQPRVEYDLSELPSGKYNGHLTQIKHDTIESNGGDSEVWRFRWTVNYKDTDYLFEDTMFVSSEKDKVEKQITYKILPYYEKGLLSDAAVNKAMDNLPGFFNYMLEQVHNTPVTLKLKRVERNGKKYPSVSVVKVDIEDKKDDDVPF